MLRATRFLVGIYKATLSPALEWLSGPGAGCRFQPTCSQYLIDAVETHGARGFWLGLKRIARCQPWGGSGYDPVIGEQQAAAGVTAFNCGAE